MCIWVGCKHVFIGCFVREAAHFEVCSALVYHMLDRNFYLISIHFLLCSMDKVEPPKSKTVYFYNYL